MRLNYRPEIDGLRAIAVTSVIFYHSQIEIFEKKLFKGGFIGVDIFFVISGYLIAQIIFMELKKKNIFSIKHFYERRVRRVLPALLFVIVFTIPFAYILIKSPSQFIDYFKSIIYSILFGSNYYFYFSGLDYLTSEALLKPLLHTWSLSIEWQFYIIFPLLLFFLFKNFKQYLIYILIIILISSFLFAFWCYNNNAQLNFYFSFSRVWELLSGSILAYFEIKFKRNSLKAQFNQFYPYIAILLIILSFFYFDNHIPHPSFATLIPVFSTCLIIWFLSSNSILYKILSSKLFTSVGLISYSLYLWHYPIFAFSRLTGFTEGQISKKILLAALIVFLSLVSYYFIEKPFRDQNFKFKKIFRILICSLLFLLIISYFSISSHLVNKKFDKILKYNEIENSIKIIEKCKISKIKNFQYCQIGNFHKKVYLIGDSHVIPLARDLGNKLNNKNFSLVLMYEPSYFYEANKIKISNSFYDSRFDFLKNVKNSILIFGGYYQRLNANDLKLLLKIYKKDFEIFRNNKNKIIFIYPVPEMHLDITKNNLFTDIKTINDRNKLAENFIDQLGELTKINPKDIMCDTAKCFPVNNKFEILKSDYDHLSLVGAKKLNEIIVKKIEIIKNDND